jgi:hypothetical protein
MASPLAGSKRCTSTRRGTGASRYAGAQIVERRTLARRETLHVSSDYQQLNASLDATQPTASRLVSELHMLGQRRAVLHTDVRENSCQDS